MFRSDRTQVCDRWRDQSVLARALHTNQDMSYMNNLVMHSPLLSFIHGVSFARKKPHQWILKRFVCDAHLAYIVNAAFRSTPSRRIHCCLFIAKSISFDVLLFCSNSYAPLIDVSIHTFLSFKYCRIPDDRSYKCMLWRECLPEIIITKVCWHGLTSIRYLLFILFIYF